MSKWYLRPAGVLGEFNLVDKPGQSVVGARLVRVGTHAQIDALAKALGWKKPRRLSHVDVEKVRRHQETYLSKRASYEPSEPVDVPADLVAHAKLYV